MSRRGENIHHRKDGLWEARYVKEIGLDGKKKYGSVYGHSYKEAKAKKQDAMDRILLYQKPTPIRSLTILELVQEWLYINKSRLKPSTYQRYVSFCNNHIKDSIGNLKAVYFTSVSVRKFAEDRFNTGLSPQTVNSILVFLHSCLKYGSTQYHLPLPEFKYFQLNKEEMRVFSQDEQKHLVDYLKNDMDTYKFGILVALYTGVRVGELCALRWEDVEPGRIIVRRTMQRLKKENEPGTEIIVGPPKTKKSKRIIPLLSSLENLIIQYRKDHANQVYLLSNTFAPLVEPRIMQYKFKRYMKDLQIEGASFHTLRHSFATRAIEAGVDIKALSEILGHANVLTTLNRYVHSSFSHQRSNMEKLASFF